MVVSSTRRRACGRAPPRCHRRSRGARRARPRHARADAPRCSSATSSGRSCRSASSRPCSPARCGRARGRAVRRRRRPRSRRGLPRSLCGGPGIGSLTAASSANSFIATNMFCASEQLQLSQPRPMRTPASCSIRIGGMPHFIFRLPCGLSTTPAPCSASSSISVARQPDAVREVESRIEHALVGEALDQQAAVFRQRQPRLQRHAAGFIDVRVDRDVVAAGEFHRPLHQRGRAALRRRRPERPGHAAAAARP